ncbi:MAG: GntR family transcriptional regulator [Dehalococcoidales bacterium]|nr:GntR family transcriptional regulator [Dehalococcoidales bacterium]
MSLLDYPDLGERVYEILRDQVLGARLAPGSHLLAVELARKLGVSRTPVKDALSRLAAQGLVEEVHRRGYYVAHLDAQGLADLLQARLLIEIAGATRRLESLAPQRLVGLGRLAAEMEGLIDNEGCHRDYPKFAAKDSQFHQAVVELADNRHLLTTYQQMNAHLHVRRISQAVNVTNERALPTLREHRAILAALDVRNEAAVRQALREHVDAVTASFLGTAS